MASTNFKIRQSNVMAHLDIERDIKKTKNGLFTFTLRVNSGNICDYVNYKNVKPEEYSQLIQAVVKQFSTSRNN